MSDACGGSALAFGLASGDVQALPAPSRREPRNFHYAVAAPDAPADAVPEGAPRAEGDLGAGGEPAREGVARVARRTFTSVAPAVVGLPPADVASWTVKHISTHFAEEITLDDLARGVGLSKFYFLRKFRKEVGMTSGAFLKRYRIVQAMERLITTRRPIHEVARMVGYKDPTAFSRAFIRVTGTQPYLFRETRRLQAAEAPAAYGAKAPPAAASPPMPSVRAGSRPARPVIPPPAPSPGS